MQQQVPPQKSTPGRRRANRHPPGGHSPARKTYASENDMPTDVQFPFDFSNASPYTPRKSASNSPAPPSTQPNNAKSKPRGGNKSRTKQSSTSPGPVRHGRTTPPQSAAQKTAAFAGATFHASPAPASLPIPSFLSKTFGSPGPKDTGPVSAEPSPPASDSEAPTPQRHVPLREGPSEESPLDFFFRADRAEKERARRASSANVLGPPAGLFSPPLQPRSPQEARTVPNGLSAFQSRRPTLQRNSSSGISAVELDGTPGKPIGPAFSTPFNERIRAARSGEKPVDIFQRPPQQQSTPVQDRGEKLKKFLAVSPTYNTGQQFLTTAGPANQASESIFTSIQQTSVLSTMGPTTPTRVNNNSRPAEILQMEDSIRRILKINLGSAGPTSYQSS
ncbi:hypothetical protein QBC46DRAFT_158254 [Diplogelasinospora grovesii]|uniref:Proteophosphoglycan 5 n=1 Tax=Diplogelasinospora grovesii TaxID=303347 RepID=A0AAN6S8S4_9PEZI|nr:hypothetical protein QBC46DRAFT_158254 [Diplogelasinospora grovesii]